jgi:hypothetical protein
MGRREREREREKEGDTPKKEGRKEERCCVECPGRGTSRGCCVERGERRRGRKAQQWAKKRRPGLRRSKEELRQRLEKEFQER